MAASHRHVSPTSKPGYVPFGFLPLVLGDFKGISSREKLRLITQNVGAWLMIGFGTIFVFVHAVDGNPGYVGLNCAFISVGALSLWLASSGFRRTSLVVISVGSGLVFFLGAIIYRNGMDNYLLVVMAASLLLFEDNLSRVLIAGMNAAAYSFLQIAPGIEVNADDSQLRNGLNILLFLLVLAGLIEFFRILNSDYVDSLECANQKLDASNDAKERLFAVIAHDLRGPVGNLKSSLELLGGGTLSKQDFHELIRDLGTDVDGALACLENLLSWSTVHRASICPAPVQANLREIVDRSIHAASFALNRKKQNLVIEVPDSMEVFVDENHLQTILRNLLSNASKFTPTGGTLSVSSHDGEDAWFIEVQDTGVGMESDEVQRLFADDHLVHSTSGTNSEHGFGLGVEIVRDFAALNHMEISAQSVLGVGTTVTLKVPWARP